MACIKIVTRRKFALCPVAAHSLALEENVGGTEDSWVLGYDERKQIPLRLDDEVWHVHALSEIRRIPRRQAVPFTGSLVLPGQHWNGPR